MRRMHRTPADHETTTEPTAEMLVSKAPATPPVTLSKRITTALAFLCGCIALLMTGFGIILPVFSRARSEEHTSELQSHSDVVCRLLLLIKTYLATYKPTAI